MSNINKLDELCLEYIGELAGLPYWQNLRKKKGSEWVSLVVNASGRQTNFFDKYDEIRAQGYTFWDWLGEPDRLLSMSEMVDAIKYIEYGRKMFIDETTTVMYKGMGIGPPPPHYSDEAEDTTWNAEEIISSYLRCFVSLNYARAATVIEQTTIDWDRMNDINMFNKRVLDVMSVDDSFTVWVNTHQLFNISTAINQPQSYRFSVLCIDHDLSFGRVMEIYHADIGHRKKRRRSERLDKSK